MWGTSHSRPELNQVTAMQSEGKIKANDVQLRTTSGLASVPYQLMNRAVPTARTSSNRYTQTTPRRRNWEFAKLNSSNTATSPPYLSPAWTDVRTALSCASLRHSNLFHRMRLPR